MGGVEMVPRVGEGGAGECGDFLEKIGKGDAALRDLGLEEFVTLGLAHAMRDIWDGGGGGPELVEFGADDVEFGVGDAVGIHSEECGGGFGLEAFEAGFVLGVAIGGGVEEEVAGEDGGLPEGAAEFLEVVVLEDVEGVDGVGVVGEFLLDAVGPEGGDGEEGEECAEAEMLRPEAAGGQVGETAGHGSADGGHGRERLLNDMRSIEAIQGWAGAFRGESGGAAIRLTRRGVDRGRAGPLGSQGVYW